MKWSKLKQLAEQSFAPEIKSRIELKSTTYCNSGCGRFYITIDGKEIATFCSRAAETSEYFEETGVEFDFSNHKQYKRMPVEYGELKRTEVYRLIWKSIHDLSVDESIASDKPFIQMLAVLDARFGKRRLKQLNPEEFHPLVAFMIKFRLSCIAGKSKVV